MEREGVREVDMEGVRKEIGREKEREGVREERGRKGGRDLNRARFTYT